MTRIIAGAVPDDAETLSQLGEVAIVKGTAVLPVRLMDWPAGLEPPLCAVKVKLVGLSVRVGLLETTRATGTSSGELEAPAPMIEMVALYVPAAKLAGLALTVRVDGVLELEIATLSQDPLTIDKEKLTGWVAATLTV